ncbi:MAG: hypothetical protein M3082_12320 [Candidatus Dormibacteraeota bacterium]|nr:hypothetical protein [Candidatus Dormibacteraeota bacterium]
MNLRYLLMALIIALVSGCGGTSGQGSPGSGSGGGSGSATSSPASVDYNAPANLDACKLLTLGDATTLLGATATAASTDRTGCSYHDPVSGKIISLVLAGAIVFDANLRALKATNQTVEDVTGLGDAAYYQLSGADAILHVKKSGADLTITALVVGGSPETVDQEKASENQIAQLAVARM